MDNQSFPLLFQSSQTGTVKTVGLISDTHISVRARNLPGRVFEVFEEVDLIVHAGDLGDISVIDQLEKIAPVLAVYGNMDGRKVHENLPRSASARGFHWKIGVIHDLALFGREKMREIAEEKQFNVLVYGHTHNPKAEWVGSTLFINPGSTIYDLPPFVESPSLALLEITEDKIIPKVVYI